MQQQTDAFDENEEVLSLPLQMRSVDRFKPGLQNKMVKTVVSDVAELSHSGI